MAETKQKKVEVKQDRIAELAKKMQAKIHTTPSSPKTGVVRAPTNHSALTIVKTPAHKDSAGKDVPALIHIEFKHDGKTVTIRDRKSLEALVYLVDSPTVAQKFFELGHAAIKLNPAVKATEEEISEGWDIL